MQPEYVSLSQALAQYLSGGHSKEGTDAQQELVKFIRFSGRDRQVADLTPQEAAEYGETLAASSMGNDVTERLQAIKGFLSFCYKSNLTETSLAKHVKARKTGRRSVSPEKGRPAVDITPEGYRHIQEELEILVRERVTVARDINLAAADKDFRENAPLDAARERQGHLEARIRELEDALQRARLISTYAPEAFSHQDRWVKLGSRVTLRDLATGGEMVYTLVPPSEANPMSHKMSNASPVGKALMDHRAGEEVVVATPRGNLRYRIEGVDL
ncbi:MAG: greA [Dehalococcoidia bacterium]|nr:greA [Dehalococcoidia bacterium]